MKEQRYTATGIWKVLKSQGRTIRWLSTQTGVPENTITKYKHGHRATIPAQFAERAATALGVPLDLLFLPVDLQENSDLLPSRNNERAA